MNIGLNTVVELNYRIEDTQGEVIDEGGDPLTYLHGGYGEFFEKLEQRLEGQAAGFEGTFHLEPEDAFGDYDANLLRLADREAFPETLEVGMRFEGAPEEEGGEPDDDGRIFTVNEITADKVLLDGNHPLAGMAIVIWLKVVNVRAATDKELEQGYAGGIGLWVNEADLSDDDVASNPDLEPSKRIH
ncbi:MAG: peptidylprolyl isomerase [Burkholderiales bacterium]|nr:peptidylprolyl isomerase [Burkholderiales bacterium]MCA3153578.1 peptidylprolyl isomerase [Burkholderiales bacterium]MCA3167580.1 peptidylprolyl isomerase [Burkholderiales bacterium]